MARNTVDVEEFVSYFPHFRGVFQLYNDVSQKKNPRFARNFRGILSFRGILGFPKSGATRTYGYGNMRINCVCPYHFGSYQRTVSSLSNRLM